MKIHLEVLDSFLSTANSIIQEAWAEVRPVLRSEKKHKVYFAEMMCLKTGRMINKFGITASQDALERFDLRFSRNKGWGYFKIRILDSFFCKNAEEALMCEKILQNKFPRNLRIEPYLGYTVSEWKDWSGVTETVVFKQGNQEGNLSPRSNVVLFSRGYAMEFFRHLKKCYLESLPFPLVKEKEPCLPDQGLLYEEVEKDAHC